MSNCTSVYLLFDERMMLHHPIGWKNMKQGGWPLSKEEIPEGYTFENPERIRQIYQRLLKLEQRLCSSSQADGEALQQRRFYPLSCPAAKRETILLAHSTTHYEKLCEMQTMTDDELEKLTLEDEEGDMFYCHDTFLAATLSCGGVVKCVDAVTEDNDGVKRSIAIVRPPGHHACQQEAMGFCFFNSVAVAAKHAIDTGRASRVLILDWDVHHGNGTQDLTYDDPNIIYVSLHRFGTGSEYFFPGTGRFDEVGSGESQGTNINIPWRYGMGNAEFAAAFCELILPVIASFEPDLILVSSGFDAAKGDLLGDCELTPDMYHAMMRSVLETAGVDVPVVVALEGGYNIDVIAKCMEAVALALLDEKWEQSYSSADVIRHSSENDLPMNIISSTPPPFKSPASDPTPNASGEGDDSTTRLRKGRSELRAYWNYDKEDYTERGHIKRSAASTINKTVSALEQTPKWKDSNQFRKLPCAKTPQKTPSRVRRTRSSTKKPENEEDVDDLSSAFHSLAL